MSNTIQSNEDKFVRIPSVQSGPYLSSNNRINISIPPNIYDMSKSYVELQVRMPTVDGESASGEGVYETSLAYNSQNLEGLFNVGLVRNCRLSSDMKGILEETQHVNRLRTNLNHFQLSIDEKSSLNNSMFNLYDRHGDKGNPCRSLYHLGSTKSTNNLARVPVMMSQIFGLGGASELDTRNMGTLDIQLELDIENITVATFVRATAIACDDIVGDTTVYKITNKIQETSDIPFYVGEKVVVKHTNGGVTVGNGLITQIERQASDGTVSITCSQTSGGAITNVTLAGIVPGGTTASVSFEGASAVMVQKPQASVDMSGGVGYMTYELEQHNGNGNTSYSDTFSLSPECVNVVSLCRGTGLYSVNDNISDYRLVLDNNNLSDRNVRFDTSLYYDSVLRTTLNQGKRLRDLNKAVSALDANFKTAATTNSFSVKMISTPTPQSLQNKLLQMNINGTGGGLLGLDVYKQVQKVVS